MRVVWMLARIVYGALFVWAGAAKMADAVLEGRSQAINPIAGRYEQSWKTNAMLVASAMRPIAAAPNRGRPMSYW